MQIKSAVLTGYGSNSYKPSQVKAYIKQLKEIGANTASLLITCHVEDKSSTVIDCTGFDSPTKNEIKDAAELIKKAKLQLNLRLYVDLQSKQWRCFWSPNDKYEALSNLKDVLVNYAQFAEEVKAESFIIGAEYCYLTQRNYTESWLEIIKEVRKNFKGKISYGANWNLPFSYKTEYEEVGFWHALDWIGIDYYLPLDRLLKINKQNLVRHHKYNLNRLVKFSKSQNKKLLITEVGFPLEKEGAYEPFKWMLKGDKSSQMQSLNYKSFLDSYENFESISGLYIWRILPNELNFPEQNEKGFYFLNKETKDVLKSKWIKRLGPKQ